jgi:hypothetical protein
VRLALAAACAALADWLFYGWPTGISLALFFGVLGVIAIASNGARAPRRVQIVMTALFVAGLVALIEDVDVLSATWSALATALFITVLTAQETSSWQRHLFDAATAPLRGPYQLGADLFSEFDRLKRNQPAWLRIDSIRPQNWRAWGLRAWRLQRYLANNHQTPPIPSDADKG